MPEQNTGHGIEVSSRSPLLRLPSKAQNTGRSWRESRNFGKGPGLFAKVGLIINMLLKEVKRLYDAGL